jgi:serine/threonine protein phosphatase 1
VKRDITDPYHLHLPENTNGRDFFLGDSHGRLDAVLVALGDAGFEPQTDRVISVGDLVDRGPNSYELLKLTRQPWFFAVRGNHETMLLETKDDVSLSQWLANGGEWFMELAGEETLDAYALALSLPIAITLDISDNRKVGVCHAEWPGDDWADIQTAMTDDAMLTEILWGRNTARNDRVPEDKTAVMTVHGHTPMEEPTKIGSALFIDTGCIYGGKLTLIDVNDALALKSSR